MRDNKFLNIRVRLEVLACLSNERELSSLALRHAGRLRAEKPPVCLRACTFNCLSERLSRLVDRKIPRESSGHVDCGNRCVFVATFLHVGVIKPAGS